MGELITADEMAERLRLKPETIRDWARDGKIPSVRVNPKVLRFDPVEVVARLKEQAAGREAVDAASAI